MGEDWMPESLPSPSPRRSELPWTYSPWALTGGAALVVAFAVVDAWAEWHTQRVSPWPSAAMFVVGFGIGLIGIRAMVNLQQKSWPYQALCRQFTGGRFLTLRSPSFSPTFRRSLRGLRMAGDLPPGPASRDLTPAFSPIVAAMCVGLMVQLWFHLPTYFFGFLGSMLTVPLSAYLWWRGLPG
jgi:hypothetical protein